MKITDSSAVVKLLYKQKIYSNLISFILFLIVMIFFYFAFDTRNNSKAAFSLNVSYTRLINSWHCVVIIKILVSKYLFNV